MEKKYFETPYLKVAHITPNIIATSGFTSTNDSKGSTQTGYEGGYAPGRYDDFEDEY